MKKESAITNFKSLLLTELSSNKVKAIHYLSYDDSEKVKNISGKRDTSYKKYGGM